MIFFKVLSIVLLISSSLAAPLVVEPWCGNLGPGSFDVSNNFTLSAYTSDPTQGQQLVLGRYGKILNQERFVLATKLTSPPHDHQFSIFSLDNGTLIPHGPSEITAIDNNVVPGGIITFTLSISGHPLTPAQIYCGVASTDPAGGGEGYPRLALNGDTNSFSLCSQGSFSDAQTVLVYKAQSGASYDFSTCTTVHVQMVGLL
ncbi:hypothetical protein C8Q75DRAFT_757911 [Abortiporus biennis]|nr:hypothetical protein C8Q75DRAFT_757911 [Abortiporus biennis]